MHTYCWGYDLFVSKDLLYRDIVKLCLDLNEEFDNKYEFEPEPISDGFIYIKKFNEDEETDKEKYKCMRIYGTQHRTPWIPQNVMEIWKDNDSVFLAAKAFKWGPKFFPRGHTFKREPKFSPPRFCLGTKIS